MTCTDLGSEERCRTLADRLDTVQQRFGDQPQVLTQLYSLGLLRYALDASVHILYNTFVASQGAPVIGNELKDLLAVIQATCLDSASGWPK